MNPYILAATAVISALAGIIGAYVALRKDRRDESANTISLLEKQNALLERQIAESNAREERREKEFAEERAEWRRRDRKNEERIDELERWRIKEIESRRQLGMCVKEGCPEYDPGDICSPEGTD